ncbi:MAG TPA: hypothetical protein VIQ74_08295 [Gemmatimonadaceae bacterium]
MTRTGNPDAPAAPFSEVWHGGENTFPARGTSRERAREHVLSLRVSLNFHRRHALAVAPRGLAQWPK